MKDKKEAKRNEKPNKQRACVQEREIYWLSSKRYTMTTIHYKQLIMGYITKRKTKKIHITQDRVISKLRINH
jgi:hypothetical protein